jgi:hypothetical protein
MIHTIYIPEGWSVEQVWEHLARDEPVPAGKLGKGYWVNVDENGRVIGDEGKDR